MTVRSNLLDRRSCPSFLYFLFVRREFRLGSTFYTGMALTALYSRSEKKPTPRYIQLTRLALIYCFQQGHNW